MSTRPQTRWKGKLSFDRMGGSPFSLFFPRPVRIYSLALEWARIYRGDDWKPRSPDPQMERLDAKRMKMVPELFKK